MSSNPLAPSTETITPEASTNKGLPKEIVGFIELVRAKLRDYTELNRLIAGQETSDRLIALCTMEAIDDFNTTPPLIAPVNLSNFPSISLLVNGTIICILTSVGLLQTRNHLSYTDGQAIQVNVSDKAPELMRWLNLFISQYEAKKSKLKVTINISGALNGTGIPSEYRYVNGLWDFL
jgi:hypothetical protein